MYEVVVVVVGTALAGCSAGSDATPDAGVEAGGGDTIVKSTTIVVTVKNAGTAKGPLTVALFTENPPKTRPPVAFDTTNAPAFPYVAKLKDLDPGTYWAIAVLDMPPLSPGAVKPGGEDIQVTSAQITIAPGEERTTEVTLPATAGDAGTD